MNNIYKALLKPIMELVVLYVVTTSGIAARIAVLETGAKKLQ
jgi:hypothetical protein